MRSRVAPMSPTPIERLWNSAFHSAHTLRACETRGFMVGCLSSTRTPRSTDVVWWCTSKLRTACFKPYPPARSPGSPQRGTCFMTHAGSTTMSLCRNLGACSLRLRLQKTVLAPCIEARRLQPLGGSPARLLQVLLLVCSPVPAFLFAPRPNLDYFRSVGGCKAGKCRERKKHQLRRCQVMTRELTGLLPVDYCDYMIGYIFMGCTPNHCHRYCVASPTDEKQPWPGCTNPTSTFVYPVCKRLQFEYLAFNYE